MDFWYQIVKVITIFLKILKNSFLKYGPNVNPLSIILIFPQNRRQSGSILSKLDLVNAS